MLMGDVVFLNFVLAGKASFSPQIVVTDLKMQMSDTDPVLTFLAVTGNFRAGSVLVGVSLRKNEVTCMPNWSLEYFQNI